MDYWNGGMEIFKKHKLPFLYIFSFLYVLDEVSIGSSNTATTKITLDLTPNMFIKRLLLMCKSLKITFRNKISWLFT